MGEDIHLRPKPEQSRLENWVEFQNYHPHRHKQMEQNIQEAKTSLDKARQESETTESTTYQRAKEDAGIYKGKLGEAIDRLINLEDRK